MNSVQVEESLCARTSEVTTLRGSQQQQSSLTISLDAKSSSLEGEVRRLTERVTEERATTMKALQEYQKRDEVLTARNQQLEADVQRLSNRLREEQAAVNALKRQTLTYQVQILSIHVPDSTFLSHLHGWMTVHQWTRCQNVLSILFRFFAAHTSREIM